MSHLLRTHKDLTAPENLPLPGTEKWPRRKCCFSTHWTTRRYVKYAIIIMTLLLVAPHLSQLIAPCMEFIYSAISSDPPLPPLYPQFYEQELRLPQHNPNLPLPEGREGKYLWVANGVWGLGWGNVMQEMIFDAYLAHLSGRSFVFNNYTWDVNGPYTLYKENLIPSTIPLRALVTGPFAGDPFPDGAPRSVGRKYFNEICPNRTVISTTEVIKDTSVNIRGDVVVNKWLDKLNSMQDRCVEIDGFSPQIFGIWVFGSTRVLDIWPSLSKSPLITHFRWSSLIHDAFNANYRRLESSPIKSETPAPDIYKPVPGLLALHIRRGDYGEHCLNLAEWRSGWNGFNSFPEFPDKFDVPPGPGGNDTDRSNEIYMKHCLPSIEQIVDKVEEVRRSDAGKGLRNIYIMTNGKRPWVADLKKALKQAGKWNKIVSSRDMKLAWEQKFVAQSVDMLIGQRAQVIIGNGFSSLTSNVVMLRMARHDLPPESNRFW